MAGSLDITNGHAARMRFSRFKQQMEGIPTQTRKTKVSTPRPKKAKKDKAADAPKTNQDDDPDSVKPEPKDDPEPMQGVEGIERSPRIKAEPKEESFEGMASGPMTADTQGFGLMSLEPNAGFGLPVPYPTEAIPTAFEIPHVAKKESLVKVEPEVKVEPCWDG